MVQWRLESPKKKTVTPERQDHPVRNTDDIDLPHSYSEKEHKHTSPKSQLAEFKEDGQGKGRGKRGAAIPPTRGRGNGRVRQKKGRGELEAIPEVASSHDIDDTYF